MPRFSAIKWTLPLLLAAAPSLASFGGSGSSSTPDRTPEVPAAHAERPVRDEAAHYYGDGYNNVARAKQDLADGKLKNAEKRFRKALERGERAVEIDSTYHEAWNLVGYCARQLKDYDRSLAAYEKCLAIKPDYAPAREYLGEAYVELGKNAAAREQLAWLEKAGATEELGRLRAAIDAWEKAHPSSAMIPTPTAGTIESTDAPRSADDSLRTAPDSTAAPTR